MRGRNDEREWIPALSLRQPWLHTIFDLGKRHENRVWRTNYRGPVLLHASSGMTKTEYYDVLEFVRKVRPGGLATFPGFDQLPRGGIVGTARIVDCVTESPSPWFFGPFAFVLEDVVRTPFIPCKGFQRFFRVPDDVVAKALEAA